MQSRGNGLTRRGTVTTLLICAAFATTTSTAESFRGHVFGKAFGSAGSGPGQFKEPAGVAVSEATGQVYVADEGNDRVEVFSAAGTFASEIKGPFTTAAGTGNLTTGSTKVEAVTTTTGTFNAGQELSAPGLPAGTTIVAAVIKSGELELELSAAATASETGSLTASESFDEPNTIAVDNTCVRLGLTETSKPKSCKEVDPSSGDLYVQDGFAHKVIDKFGPSGEFIAQILVPKEGVFLLIRGVAVDEHGDLWVAEEGEHSEAEHSGFDEFNNAAVTNGFEGFHKNTSSVFLLKEGLALDTNGHLYSAITFGAPLEETIAKFDLNAGGEAEPINEALIEETSTGVASEYPSNNIYIDAVKSVVRLDGKESPSQIERLGEEEGQKRLSGGSGIAVNSTPGQYQVYVADRSADHVVEFELEPPGPPTIEHTSLSQVTATSATFRAEINPRGAQAAYRFEFGRCATEASCKEGPYENSTPVPDGPVGADFELHEVSTHPQDLSPATTYHFRVVAHNGLLSKEGKEEVVGEEVTFTTQPAGVFGLPDGRGWEMVSPAQKHGTRIQTLSQTTPIQAALAGDAITYLTDSPTEDEPSGYADAVQVLSSRTAEGWRSKDITLTHERGTGLPAGTGNEYRASSEDLKAGIVQPFGSFVALSPDASEQAPYLHTNYLGENASEFCESGCFRPLVTAGNTAEGAQFGEEGKCPPRAACGPVFVGANGDLSAIILRSEAGLTATPGDKGGLYERKDGRLSLVSVLPGPGGKPASPGGAQALGRETVARNAVSPDGERVVWSTNGGHLYLRELEDEETTELDKGLSGKPEYQTADAQTRRIFFTDEGDLYLYDAQSKHRTQLTSGAAVQGIIAGASEDGSYLYFVANGQLPGAEGTVSGNCRGEVSSAAARCNLYELHEEGGQWKARLVAVLSGEDFPDFSEMKSLPGLTARVSPSGRSLAFMSAQPLTKYDNRDANSGKRDEEVYLFDAATNALTCASCNPTGSRPEGIEAAKLEHGPVAGEGVWPPGTWLAANVPGWTPYRLTEALYQSRYLDDSGRLFFNSSDALSPQDVNGTEDVYEYEPPGFGSCTTENALYSSRSGGCVGLISSGTSREESGFLDASQSGSDVFFLTTAKLSPEDFDTALDVYDAHECSSSSPCVTAPGEPAQPCASEATCKAPPTPQPEIFGAPASATFSGLGNPAPPPPAARKPPTKAQLLAKARASCRATHKGKAKRARKRRSTCEARARTKYGTRLAAKKKPKKRGKT
jgi:DNA-binding beta-propeller fold protein YncE